MSEINNTPSNTTLNAVIAEALEQQKKRADTLELALTEAEARAKELEGELEGARNTIRFTGEHLEKWASQWQSVKSELTEYWEQEDFSDGTAFGQYLIETFEIETEEEVKVTLTITYSGKVKVAKGAELGDLCLEVSPDNEVTLELDGESVGDLTLDGTDYDY